jgi:tRNA threonylcarbamoyladenosine biosynthesis protein TsaB
MLSLRSVLETHGSALVLDASSSRIHAGYLQHGADDRWECDEDEAGVAVFRCAGRLTPQLAEAGAFVFCEGPGSILGIRTVAMALRTWGVHRPRPCFAYSRLALVAHALKRPDLRVIADARRDTWHVYRAGTGLTRIAASELGDEPLVMPEGFRHWSALPPQVTMTPYNVPELLRQTRELELLRETANPDAFLHEEPSYVTWTPQVHRAPTHA